MDMSAHGGQGWVVPQAADANTVVALRVTRGRERLRRRQVLRGVLLLLLIGVLLCAGAVRFRNRGRLTTATADFEAQVAGLVRTYHETGTLPLFYPPRDAVALPTQAAGFTYLDSATLRHLRDSSEDLIVAYSGTVRQILGPDARVVAVRQGGQIRITTMRTPQFQQLLAEQEQRAAQAIEQARRQGVSLP